MVYKAELGARVLEERVRLEFLSQNYFKPYFPYYGKVMISILFISRRCIKAKIKIFCLHQVMKHLKFC